MSRKIFIIGLCRSGTTWLGEILRSHPEIYGTNEPPEVFHDLIEMAQDPVAKVYRFPKIVDFYRSQHDPSNPRHYCDKSHFNLWFVEELSLVFPDSKFVGIQREPYPVVASMLLHQHSLEGLFNNAGRYSPDNPVLGTTYHSDLSTYSRVEKAALRWKSHWDRMQSLLPRKDVLVVGYEQLQSHTEEYLSYLQDFLELAEPFSSQDPNSECLDKWKSILSKEDIKAIDKIVR